jgi:ribosome-binding factor A
MPREFSRTRRVEEEIRRVLAEMMLREVADPRIAHLTLSDVEVSRDLAHAKVFVTCLEEPEAAAEALRALRHAGGFLRTGLARRLKMRAVPDLRFFLDTAFTDGARLDALIDQAVTGQGEPGEGEEH